MRFLGGVLVVVMVACASRPDVEALRARQYDGEPAQLFREVVAATVARYGRAEAIPEERLIKTAWHQVTTGDGEMSQLPTRRSPEYVHKRHFVRFDVKVVGTRPYTVEVIGHAASWQVGDAKPTLLDGAAAPSYLAMRTDELVRRIHQRLAPYAVRVTAPAATR